MIQETSSSKGGQYEPGGYNCTNHKVFIDIIDHRPQDSAIRTSQLQNIGFVI